MPAGQAVSHDHDPGVSKGSRGDLGRALEQARRRIAGLEARATDLAGEVAGLVAANAGLQRENERLRKRVAELEVLAGERGGDDEAGLRRRIAELEGRVAGLERELLDARRAAKRQAAPFGRRKAKRKPKKPGRKPGHAGAFRAPPGEVDRTEHEPLKACPHCGCTDLRDRQDHENYVLELLRKAFEAIRYVTESGYCPRCRRRVRSRHPEQPSVAGGAAMVCVGPQAVALAVALKVRHGVAMRRVGEFFATGFGIGFTAGGLAQMLQRLARRLEPVYRALISALQVADAVFADETGWRIVRATRWLWVFCTAEVTVYVVDARRSHEVPLEVLGPGFVGLLHHDGARTYDALTNCLHQTCLEHILRDLDELGEIKTRGAVRWPRAIAELLRDAIALRRTAGVQSGVKPGDPADRIETRLDRLLLADLTDPDNARMQRRLERNREWLFPFLYLEEAEATNSRAERQLRPMIIGRKIGACNRSEAGARAHQILASLIATARQQGHNEVDVLRLGACGPPDPVIRRLLPAAARSRKAVGAPSIAARRKTPAAKPRGTRTARRTRAGPEERR
ncbi:MAG: IS66 family transposase [bacterium]